MSLSFLEYFTPSPDGSVPADRRPDAAVQSHREHLERIRGGIQAKQSTIDLARRVTLLETHVAEAAVVIEALIELLEARVGIPRNEVLARLDELKVEAAAPDTRAPSEIEAPSMMPIDPKPLRLATGDAKDPFEPRRKWRDARSRI